MPIRRVIGAGEESQEQKEAPSHTIDTRPMNAWTFPGGTAELSLHRVDDDHMLARMTLTNEEGNQFHNEAPLATHLADDYGEWFGTNHDYPDDYFSGVAWLDPQGRTLHKPYHLEDRSCLCTGTQGDAIYSQGDTWQGHAVLEAPPEGVEELTVITHVAPPFVNVPVQEGAPEGLDYTAPDEEPEAEPEQASLESVIDSEEETVIEDAETTDINLSTDVLFELEESELTGEADGLVEGAAQQIEDSGATEVTIEGHADSSGNDEINDPLSEERAEAVREALDGLIETDIDFSTEGLGSREPIAGNDDEEGRALNRRVTISVPRGTPAEPEQAGEESDGDGEAEPAQGEGTPATEVTLTGPEDADDQVELTLTDLRAVTPDTALLSYEITNPDDGTVNLRLDLAGRWGEFRAHAAHAVTFDEPGGDRPSHPLRVESLDTGKDGEKRKPYCLCSSTAGSNSGSTVLDSDESAEYYVLLPIAPDSTVTDITIADLGTAEDVAISR